MSTQAEVVVVTPLKGVNYDPQPGGASKAKPGMKIWRVRLYRNGREKQFGRYETVAEANAVVIEQDRLWDEMHRECPVMEMPVAACAHCKGVDLPKPMARPKTRQPSDRMRRERARERGVAEVVVAHRDFKIPCADCMGLLAQGQRLRAGATGLLVHEVCPVRT